MGGMRRMGRLSALVAVVLVTCAATDGAEKDGDYLKPGTNTEDAGALMVKAFNAFSMDLYKKAGSATEGNVVLSPLSAGLLLALTRIASGGVTAQELGRALHLPQYERVVAQGAKALVSSLQPPQNPSGNAVLRLANRLYAQRGLRLMKDFVGKARNYFEADAQELDFHNDQEATRDAINQWVEEYTAGKIKEFMPKEWPATGSMMVLVNAVYLKADWLNPFDKTELRRFYLSSTSEVDVLTMCQIASLNFGNLQQLNATALELPVKGGRLKMVFILPYSVDGLPQLEAHLDHLNIKAIPWKERTVAVSLPKFHIEATHDLVSQLKELGVQELFTTNANLFWIAEEEAYVTDALQKTFIDVNELGIEAAAASGMAVLPKHSTIPAEFDANHPFLFFITNEEAILFLGRVKDPRQK
ncbi:hypothetical protein R5R35_011615 [Gryllus longicercus]|uniref:Serpin domain-containing protein n=1 Tax=Gryllus longicercus TaxID=2509291 RepID=A0AAN9Z7W9_9ORTH